MATKKANNTEEIMNENTEIVPQVNATELATNNSGMICTINTGTMQDRVTVYNALNNAQSLTQAKDDVIQVANIILMPGVRKGRNGQADAECVNTYLIDTEDNAWFTQSDGIARSANSLITMFFNAGLVSKDNPLSIKVVSQELSNGNTIKSLALDM